MPLSINIAGQPFDLSKPRVMGILNVTPDSFSDGGRYTQLDAALYQAEQMCLQGASILDIGGESTRPGAAVVSVNEELDRVIPVIEKLKDIDIPISIDTSKPEVMREAVAAGADLINDVTALSAEHAIKTAADLNVPVCLMHMQGQPENMQQAPAYQDVVADVAAYLQARVAACEQAGIDRQRILIDPGFGFGKTTEHNLLLLKHLPSLGQIGLPLLVGLSRKTSIGAILSDQPDQPAAVDQRLFGSIAAATIAAYLGASILRVHDVAATVDALKIVSALASVSIVNPEK